MKQRFLIVFSLLFCVTPVVFSQSTHVITYTADEISNKQYWKSFSPSFPVTVPQQDANGDFGVYVASVYNVASPTPTLTMTAINASGSTAIDAATGILIKSTRVGSITLTETEPTTYYSGTNYLIGTGATAKSPASLKDGENYLMVLHKTWQYFVSYIGDDDVPANKAVLILTDFGPESSTSSPSIRIVEEPAVVTALDNCAQEAKSVKILRDGQLYIIRDGITYDLMGRTIR